jgi:hypothetical protein
MRFPASDEIALKSHSLGRKGMPSVILELLFTVFFGGLALLLGVLTLMRGLYAGGHYHPPLIADDCPQSQASSDTTYGENLASNSWPTVRGD